MIAERALQAQGDAFASAAVAAVYGGCLLRDIRPGVLHEQIANGFRLLLARPLVEWLFRRGGIVALRPAGAGAPLAIVIRGTGMPCGLRALPIPQLKL